jgi:hypothetical protein
MYQLFVFFGMSSSSSCVGITDCRSAVFFKIAYVSFAHCSKEIGNKENGEGF